MGWCAWPSSKPRIRSEATLVAFCDQLLQRYPLDVRALWTIVGSDVVGSDVVGSDVVGSDVVCCSNSITERCWSSLLELGDFEPRWLVLAYIDACQCHVFGMTDDSVLVLR
jgi:hypothetical protein